MTDRRDGVHPLLVRLVAALLLATAVAVGAVVPIPPAAHADVTSLGSACTLPRHTGWEQMPGQLRAGPRIILGTEDLLRAQQISRSSELAPKHRQQLRHADLAVEAARPTYGGSNTSHFVLTGRAATARMTTLAYAYTTTGQARYADRIRQDVADFVAFPDWSPHHLLGTAEITTAVAFGYSFTRDLMTAPERDRAVAALRIKAFAPAACAWLRNDWQVNSTHNWGVVTNTGFAMGALAILDVHPGAAASVLGQALPRANRAIATSSDGGTPEGPSYAGLIGTYTAYAAASFAAAFGADKGPFVGGIPQAARYVAAVTGPTNQLFNYADANTGRLVPLLPLWNARMGGDPVGAWLARRVLAENHPNTLLLLWDAGAGRAPSKETDRFAVLPQSGVAVMRSGPDTTDTWVGVKGGSNAANHAHLDLGSFSLDMLGQRFVSDPGADDYGAPGYFTVPSRYLNPRVASPNHSTITNAGHNQAPTAVANLSRAVETTPSGARRVLVSTTQALGVRWAQRAVTLGTGDAVSVRDVARAAAPALLRWTAVTEADVSVSADGRTATLTRGGRRVDARLGEAPGARFTVRSMSSAASPGLSNEHFSRLTVDLSTQPSRVVRGEHAASVTVTFLPVG
jgi:hypothetical protein